MRAYVYTRGLGTRTASQHNTFDSEKLKSCSCAPDGIRTLVTDVMESSVRCSLPLEPPRHPVHQERGGGWGGPNFRFAGKPFSHYIIIHDIHVRFSAVQSRNRKESQLVTAVSVHQSRREDTIMLQTLGVLHPINREGSYQGETKCISTTSKITIRR